MNEQNDYNKNIKAAIVNNSSNSSLALRLGGDD
jgi:hypothetical protein